MKNIKLKKSYYLGQPIYLFGIAWLFISSIGLLIFVTARIYSGWQKNGLSYIGMAASVLFFIFMLLISIGISYKMHYFALSEHYFLAHNYILFWQNRVYHLNDIYEIVLEPGKGKGRVDLVRVITKDFKYALYPAGTLSGKTWEQLEKDLKGQGISIRNER